jgi:parallel beta-helix repeat protein
MHLRSWLASLRCAVANSKPKRRPRPAPACERLEDRTLLSTFTVNSTLDKVDTTPGNGIVDTGTANEVTLRAAVMEANAHSGADTIVLGAGTYTLTLGGGNEDAAATGDLDITGGLTITGAGAGVTIIDAAQLDRVFDIKAGATVTISGVTMTNGIADGGGALRNRGTLDVSSSTISHSLSQGPSFTYGGGIDNEYGGVMHLSQCTLTENKAGNWGGGFWNNGTATVSDCLFTGNWAGDRGGGIIDQLYNLTVIRSTFINNRAGSLGGAIDNNGGTETITDCTITGNTADRGAGLSNGGFLTISGTTINDNTAVTSGGAIFSSGQFGTMTVTNSTLSGNYAGLGGGIRSESTQTVTLLNCTLTENWGGVSNVGSMTLKNTIVAGNLGVFSPDVDGAITSQGFNLIGNTSGGTGFIASDRLNLNPLLGPLQDNGGPTFTRGLLAGSPALDTGTNNGAPATDQRGQARPQDGDNNGTATVDIGSFEGVVATVPPPPPSGLTFTVNSSLDKVDTNPGNGTVETGTSGEVTLRAAVMEANAHTGSDTIVLGAGTYKLTLAGINEDAATMGDLDVTDDLTIQGAGAGTTTIDAAQLDRVLQVLPGVKLTLSGVTITGGFAQSNHSDPAGAGILSAGWLTATNCTITGNAATLSEFSSGGGIFSMGPLSLSNCTISQNKSSNTAGGIYSSGQAKLDHCTVSSNTTNLRGGGIVNGGTLLITDSQISGNVTTGGDYIGGAGIQNGGVLTVTNTKFLQNASASLAGAIHNSGTATVTNATFSGNSAGGDGGAVANREGNFTILSSQFTGNSSHGYGGAINNDSPDYQGVTTIVNCTISGNSSDRSGGGAAVLRGGLNLQNSTISANSAMDEGGGFTAYGGNGQGVATNCTFSGNRSSRGGGISVTAGEVLALLNCTVADNRASTAGGGASNAGTLNSKNTIIANNTSGDGPDLKGKLNSQGFNLIGNTGGGSGFVTGDLLNVNPVLGPLQDNGGPTFTQALYTGSPAIDAGTNTGAPSTDQRGQLRPQDGDSNGTATVDIGAFEGVIQGTPPPPPPGLTLTVNSTLDKVDTNPGNGTVDTGTANEVTLRAAVMEANAHSGADTIVLGAGTFKLTIAGTNEDAAAKGDLDITDDLTIQGAGAGVTIIDAAQLDRVLQIMPLAKLTLSGVTIKGGNASTFGGGIYNQGTLSLSQATVTQNTSADWAGGLYSTGQATVSNCVFSNNTITTSGQWWRAGAISNHGTMTISACTFTSNSCTSNGSLYGAGAVGNDATLTVTDSTFSQNSTIVMGGGLLNHGTVNVTNCKFSNNSAGYDGGGVRQDNGTMTLTGCQITDNTSGHNGGGVSFVDGGSSLTIVDCSISGNSAQYGGGIGVPGGNLIVRGTTISDNKASIAGGGVYLYRSGSIGTLTNCTIVGNTSVAGGGVALEQSAKLTFVNCTITDNQATGAGGGASNSASTLTLKNTIVADNTGATSPDIAGSITSQGNNLIGNTSGGSGFGASDLKNVNPLLGPLQDNGGPTFTQALLAGSPAIDAGTNSGAPATDQRGQSRPFDADSNGTATVDIGAFELQVALVNVLIDANGLGGNGKDNGQADHFLIRRNGANLEVLIDGTLSQTVAMANVGKINVNGSGDADSLVVDFSGGNPCPALGIQFAAAGGSDSLQLTGETATAVTHTLTGPLDGSLQVDSSTMSYTGTEAVSDLLGAATRTFLFGAGADNLVVSAGTAPSDDVTRITRTGGNTLDFQDPTAALLLRLGDGDDTLTLSGLDTLFAAGLTADGEAGNDLIAAAALNYGVTLSGSGGNDTVQGGTGADSLSGGDQHDQLTGAAGSDTLAGGNGDDTLLGGADRDSLAGGAGNDRLRGQGSTDTLDGGLGTDIVTETADVDFTLTNRRLIGQGGDFLQGFEQAIIVGGASNNTLDASGFSGQATLVGGAGDDSILGGSGNDVLNGEDGNDTLDGGAGADSLDGGDGLDLLWGNAGADTLTGGLGNDSLDGGDGNDVQYGLAGNDVLNGRAGDDTLLGGDGDDTLLGGQGRDLLLGEAGADVVNGQGGLDQVTGGGNGAPIDPNDHVTPEDLVFHL